jgi:hypothetical protein
MFDLTLAALMMVTAHVGAVYVGTDILRLGYVQILGLNVALGIAISILTQVTLPEWKPKLEAELSRDTVIESSADMLGMIAVFMAGSSASGFLLYRRFGVAGWIGMLGSSALVNYLM